MANDEACNNGEVRLNASFEELVDQARKGNQAASNELFGQLRSYLLLIANDHLDQRLQAKVGPSDIVQQSMVRAVEQLEQYRGSTAAEFKGWLRQILVNEAKLARRGYEADKRDLRRETRIGPAVDDSSQVTGHEPADAQLTPRAHALADEQSAVVRQLIDQLPEQFQTVIRLRNWEELSFEEIGRRMNMSTSGVAKLWYRALVELQKLYQQQNESRIT